MQVNITGRHMGISEPLKRHCHEKAARLPRFLDRIQSIDVILDGKAGVHTAQMIVHAAGAEPFIATEQHDDAFAAVDLVVDKVEEQVRRYKEKLRNRKHPPRGTGTSGVGTGETEPL